MTRDESDRLRDIKDAIVTIREHLARAEEDPHAKDAALLHDALLFQFVGRPCRPSARGRNRALNQPRGQGSGALNDRMSTRSPMTAKSGLSAVRSGTP